MSIEHSRGKVVGCRRICFAGLLVVAGVLFFSYPVVGGGCADGSCTFNPGGGSSGGGASIRSMERDWRTRLLVDNLGRDGLDAADSDGAMAAAIPRQNYALRKISLNYFGSFQISQYPPYDDWEDRVEDTEYRAETAVEAVYPWDERTEFTGRLSLRHEWSRSDPTAFPHYSITFVRADVGVRRKLTDNWTATLKIGSFEANDSSGKADDEDLDPELLYNADLEYHTPRFRLRGGTSRDMFGSPDERGYHLANAYMDYLESEIRPIRQLRINLRGDHFRFTDDTDDYEDVEGTATCFPDFFPEGLGLKGGGRYEFREDENESILIGGLEWTRSLGVRNNVFLSFTYYGNTTTKEREVVSELRLGRVGLEGRHGGAFGVSWQWEYHVYDRYSVYLFFRVY
jgi:hypothetical protein